MKAEIVQQLTSTFEGHAQQTENGIEYWLARDLQFLLGYSRWENFSNTVVKAKTACEVSGHDVDDHFRDVTKMVDIGSGTQREIEDIMLPAEDLKKVERRLATEDKKSLSNPDSLED